MSAIDATEQELNAMLDEGVSVRISQRPDSTYVVDVAIADEGCADCLVPDATLSSIAQEALQRHGAQVSSVVVQHPGRTSAGSAHDETEG